MYKNPIEMTYGELQTQMMQEEEKLVMKAVRNVGVNVDKGALIKALQYDRNQYTKGYKDGKNEVLDKIRAEIEMWHKEGTNWSDIRLMNIENIINKYKAESEEWVNFADDLIPIIDEAESEET